MCSRLVVYDMLPKVIIYHTKLNKNPAADDLDVMGQVDVFKNSLEKLGYSITVLPFPSKDRYSSFGEKEYAALKSSVKFQVEEIKPEFIVNLVESINGKQDLCYVAPKIFSELNIPFTGNHHEPTKITTNKLLAKNHFREYDIRTPNFITMTNPRSFRKGFYVIKSESEHASVGLEGHSFENAEEVMKVLNLKRLKGNPSFAENYIDGREFNISVVSDENGNPRVLPIAEMLFKNWPDDKMKIIDYNAKWNDYSFESRNTVRSFAKKAEDAELYKDLERLAKRCWNMFGLKGYVRVDVRVDKNNNPFVLEINTNPCISADSGFIAAAKEAGFTMPEIINRIVKDAHSSKIL